MTYWSSRTNHLLVPSRERSKKCSVELVAFTCVKRSSDLEYAQMNAGGTSVVKRYRMSTVSNLTLETE